MFYVRGLFGLPNQINCLRHVTWRSHEPRRYFTAAVLKPKWYLAGNKFQKRDNILALDFFDSLFRTPPSMDQQFLDVGCAIGDFTRNVLLPRSDSCWRIVGVDSSSSMIDYARQNFADPRICYDVLDIAEDVSGFLETYGSFDRLYSFYCFHWVKDQRKAFENVASLLTPGGECLLQFCARNPLFEVWRDVARTERWRPHMTVSETTVH